MLTVHMDKKWFFAKHDGSKVYLTADEFAPTENVRHKSHIKKVMFVGAVARPRIQKKHTKDSFDGKIAMIPFTESYVTARASKNRPAGELMLRIINTNCDAMRKRTIMIGDAINDKRPRKDIGKTIKLQMDNATPHITKDDPEWIAAKSRWSFNIVLVRQPPQSPDCKVLDLGLWTSIQALQRKEPIIINA